jgi:hypothetical protein
MLRNPSTTAEQRTAMLIQLRNQSLSQQQTHATQLPHQWTGLQDTASDVVGQQQQQEQLEILPLYIAPKPSVTEEWEGMVHPELTALLSSVLLGGGGGQIL